MLLTVLKMMLMLMITLISTLMMLISMPVTLVPIMHITLVLTIMLMIMLLMRVVVVVVVSVVVTATATATMMMNIGFFWAWFGCCCAWVRITTAKWHCRDACSHWKYSFHLTVSFQYGKISQRTHDAIMPLLRQNDITTSLDVIMIIITSSSRWVSISPLLGIYGPHPSLPIFNEEGFRQDYRNV